jgi:hypothetical protein
LIDIPAGLDLTDSMGHPKALSTPATADWWVSLAIEHKDAGSMWELFKDVHETVRVVVILFQTLY